MAKETKIRQWILNSQTQNPYYSVVNFDISGPSYSWHGRKPRNESFYYTKRLPYWKPNSVINLNYSNYNVTDISSVNKQWCNQDDCTKYYMLQNPWNTGNGQNGLKIVTKNCSNCTYTGFSYRDNNWNVVQQDSFCDCQFPEFLKTWFVSWAPKKKSDKWIQRNILNWTVGTFRDTNSMSWISIWDWIYVYKLSNTVSGANAMPWQARQVLRSSTDENGNSIFIVDSPRSSLDESQEGDGAEYKVYPERGEVMMYVSCNEVRIIHALHWDRDWSWNVVENYISDVTTIYAWFNQGNVVYSLDEFNNQIYILGSKWYILSWGLAADKMLMTVSNTNYVGSDKLSQTTFRNFLIQFWPKNLSVVVQQQSNSLEFDSSTFSYNLDSSVGIFSPNAYIAYQNWLYMVASDKRLYSINIASDWGNGFLLELTDQSWMIKGDLDLLRPWDDVRMDADGTHMYIFINNKTSISNTDNTKTRILKFYNDYNTWVRHDICCAVISRKIDNEYIGEWLFVQSINTNWETKDCNTNYVAAYIEAIIGENWEWQEFNSMQMKELKWLKILLGKWYYHDTSTRVVIDYWTHWYNQQFQSDKIEHIEWIDRNNKLRDWTVTSPSECAMELLAECTNVVKECSTEIVAGVTTETIDCYEYTARVMDNSMCVDDVTYEMSDIYNLWLNLWHLKRSDIYRIKIMSMGWDTMAFGGMVAWVDVYGIDEHDKDMDDVMNNGDDCCSEGQFINLNNPCGC